MNVFSSRCKISNRTGYDAYSNMVFASPVTVACAVIESKTSIRETSPRHELSGSRASAEEETGTTTILVYPNIQVSIDDKIELDGNTLRVKSVMKCRDVRGVIHHQKVTADEWH